MLLEREGRIVTREEIKGRLGRPIRSWISTAAQARSNLRRDLGGPRESSYIENLGATWPID